MFYRYKCLIFAAFTFYTTKMKDHKTFTINKNNHNKHITALHLLCMFLLTLCPQLTLAEETPQDDAAQSQFDDSVKKRVKVGFYPLDGYQNKQGNRKSGYGYDFLQLVRRFSDLNFDYVGYDKSWEENLRMLENGEIDLMTGVHKTPERELIFDYSYPIGTNSINLYAREGDTRYKTENYSTYNGMVVGLVDGDVSGDRLKTFAEENNFTYYPTYFDDFEQLYDAINSHKVDAICESSLLRTRYLRVLDSFANENIYAVVKRGDRALLTQINEAISNMHRVERDWSLRLNQDNYYFEDVDARIDFSEKEKQFIASHSNGKKKVLVAVDQDWRPYAWYEDGEYHGVIVDFFDNLMMMAGIDYEFYHTDKSIINDDIMRTSSVDLYLASNDDVQEAEQKGYVTTPVYLEPTIALLRRKDHSQVRTIAMSRTTPTLNRVASMTNKVEFTLYDNPEASVRAVIDGRADATYLYSYTAQQYIEEDRTGQLMLSFELGRSVPLRMIAREEDGHELISILTQCIRSISQSDQYSIATKYLTPSVPDITFVDFFMQHQVSILAVLAAIVIVILLYQRHQTKLINQHDRAARKAAEAANEAKTTFLFNMSHDIRTPMNAIIGFTELLRRHDNNPELRLNYYDKISKSSNVLLSIINNVLEMARIESGHIQIDEGVLKTGTIGESLYPVIDQMMVAKGITFTYSIDVKHPYIYCDKAKIREVLLNLLSNAYKYTNTGGKAELKIYEIACEKEGYARYVTQVIDTGIGMKKEFLEHIFDQFSREHNTTENKIEGTGLGMAIVKRYVELMGGTIQVESEVGVGSTFTVTIDHRIAEPETPAVDVEEVEAQKQFSGHRILLAEDNELNAEIAMEILSEAGFEIDHAENGQICVDMLQKAPSSDYYDLILMDVQMPVMNGYEATRQIRTINDPVKASIPVIAMTANAFEEDKRTAKEAGMNAHLAKPIDVQALFSTLANYIK